MPRCTSKKHSEFLVVWDDGRRKCPLCIALESLEEVGKGLDALACTVAYLREEPKPKERKKKDDKEITPDDLGPTETP
jgi:hypothetical protein